MEIFIQANIGYVSSFHNPHTPKELFRKARIALAYATMRNIPKTKYTTDIDFTSRQSTTMLIELKDAIENNQLQLVCQPIVDISKKTAASIEFLLRWQHPTKGAIRPVGFLAKSKSTNLNRPISYCTLKNAFDFIHELSLDNILPSFTINISPENLLDPEFKRLLRDHTYKNRISPQKITLEIPEAAIMSSPEENIKAIKNYTDLGFQICIDNFGRSSSCLHYLNKIPASAIKLDKRFLKGITADPNLKSIIKNTIQLCHDLDIKVIAQGVEDYSTLSIIQELNCDLAQGYLICTPLSKSEISEWLSDSYKITKIFRDHS